MKKIEKITITITKDFRKDKVLCSAATSFEVSGVMAVESVALAESDCAPIVDAIVSTCKNNLEAPGEEVTFAEPPTE
tara:strand:- start:237 stop:467 length:231 start_codon:yes stop_codon:yes gene_type:complete